MRTPRQNGRACRSISASHWKYHGYQILTKAAMLPLGAGILAAQLDGSPLHVCDDAIAFFNPMATAFTSVNMAASSVRVFKGTAKPILSNSFTEARRRALNLYRAWYREVRDARCRREVAVLFCCCFLVQ